ncbi:aarF domain-containing kinase [Cladophialophora yegresii CBS 114405]|uniref:AarF domain-containing kinase n=1 Tax=Cladophialophora yegresii CBS 114405 TaxID=1182544 RepID=W9WHU2_9EURO|nr:aarF domain-containing kinase [Cladophialophora yegresii CBS 114405]EXJ64550.1 aarF domain-containing kinase [Cladophialophora yegresii CBS 114405]
MSGKRILDAIALLSVSKNIAVKHFDIRFGQAKVYSQSSSIAKAVRRKGLPILSTAVSRFASSQSSSKPQKEGILQDHFYKPSAENTATESAASGDLNVEQAQADRAPLPDGTIPPQDSAIGGEAGDGMTFNKVPAGETAQHPVESQGAQDIHFQSSTKPNISGFTPAESLAPNQARNEDPIPAQTAEPPSAEDSAKEFGVEQEQDVFYQPPDSVTPVLSALPRVRVPTTENDVQEGDSHIEPGLNADVYYHGSTREVAADEPSEEQLSQIFHNPKHARMFAQKAQYAPGGVQPGVHPASTRRPRNFHTMTIRHQKASDTDTESLKQLGADLAKDVQKINTQQQQPYQMRESKVPSSRVGRIFEFGGLAASMAFGAVSESISRSGGANGSLMLSAANMERLVAKLSKMRGAALKLGQMMSFQDSKLLPKPIHDVLQRVQDSADYMPASQRDAVIAADLGPNWRDKLFQQFDERPMAAASIGQVHGAVLQDGRRVAVKVQYPGVADSISSDLNNLSLLLSASRLLPKGLYLEKTIANARTELAWECDYVREADAAKRFGRLLADEKVVFAVPEIIDEASGERVLTMERMDGIPVTRVQNFTQEQKDWIGSQILRLCLREITEFRYMQTDPNWTNFLYNAKTNKLELLDFGASREFPERFINLYVKTLMAASRKDRKACGDLSVQLGYLTGYESKAMYNAHIDSVMTLAEPFMDFSPDVYDFQDQTITDRVRELIPVMLRERLAPPPEETYSLHRKLSGAFLLCARLGSRVRCKELFAKALTKAGLR